MTQERDCNTCRHHVQGASIDDAPERCWGCASWKHLSVDKLPGWEPIVEGAPLTATALQASMTPAWMQTNAYLPPPAPAMLHKAAELMEERGRQYDQPEGERSMGRCIKAFNAITGRDVTEAEGWLLMQILKDVRQWSRKEYHRDSAEDCIAYAALKAEALAAHGA